LTAHGQPQDRLFKVTGCEPLYENTPDGSIDFPWLGKLLIG
jgi:hypothetical protein